MTPLRGRSACTGPLLLIALLTLPGASPSAAGDVKPGAYCPFPAEGETPRCMQPAKRAYGEFFAALDEPGGVADDAAARVEADVARGGGGENAYLALSSLAYGYYRLSVEAAAAAHVDPGIVARLERWNALLGRAYGRSPEGDPFRAAVREAAHDLRRRAPAVVLRCVDARGETTACESTEVVVRGIDAAAADVGIRGGLERLLERIVGGAGQ
jgi:hypothetical protein